MFALSKHHQYLDGLLTEAMNLAPADRPKATVTFDAYSLEIREHMRIEDETVFGPFEARTGMTSTGPTQVLRREHREIERRLDEVKKLLGTPEVPAVDIQAEIRALKALLGDHHMREEEIVYPACDRILSHEEREAVVSGVRRKPA